MTWMPLGSARSARVVAARAARAALVTIALARPALAQNATTTFVIRADSDTVAVERVTRAPSQLTGDLRIVAPDRGDSHAHYDVFYRLTGAPDRVEIVEDARSFFTGTIAFDEHARQTARSGAGGLSDRTVIAPPDALPIVGISIALMEQAIRSTHPAVGETARVRVINIRNRIAGTATIFHNSADSVVFVCESCQRPGGVQQLRFAVSRDGGILGGTAADQHWVITRVGPPPRS